MRQFSIALALSLSTAGLAVAHAQAPAAPAAAPVAAGMAVKDTQGGDVGTVVSTDGQFIVIKTDKHEARLPVASFTPHDGALLFGMSRDALNAEIEKSLAAGSAKIAAGATVTGTGGATVGTIAAVDAQSVTIKLASGNLVRVPRSGVAPGPNGVVVGTTAAQLEAAAKQPAGAGGGAK